MHETTRTPRILLVESEPTQAYLIQRSLLEHFGHDRVRYAPTLCDAEAIEPTAIDLALVNLDLPDGSGMELLPRMLARREDLPIIFITGEGQHDQALDAIHRGAYDYIVRAGDYLAALPVVVEKNLAIWRTKRENTRLHSQLTATLDDLREKNEQLEEVVAQLRSLVTTDPLTNLANRRAFNEELDRMFDAAQRYSSDLACVMIDLDRFKQLNDSRGHQAGDELLRRTGRVLKVNCRSSDIAARFGGDEFVLLLPSTDADTAVHACQRIADEFRVVTADLFQTEHATLARVTMSMGIASVRGSTPANPSQLIAHADQALYRAKQSRSGEIAVYHDTAVAI